jgi:transcriptional antiterminator NusG
MRFNEHNRTLIREVAGVVDFVGGEDPLAKKSHSIQHSERTPVMIRDQVIERLLGRKYQFYVIQTHSQFESHVISALNHHRAMDEETFFKGETADLFINSAQFVASDDEVIDGEAKKKFTGYIYVSMHMSIDSWHHVKSIPKVSGFVGGKNIEEVRPISLNPLSETSSQRQREALEATANIVTIEFETGDIVDIIDGPFATYMGQVQEVTPEQERLRVLIDPSRSLLTQRDQKDRSRFSTDLHFSAEVTWGQVKKLS